MSTRSLQGKDVKPLDTIPEDKKVKVQRTQSGFDPFEKPAGQVKRVHSENNACISSKSAASGKESPKLRRHSSPSSVSDPVRRRLLFISSRRRTTSVSWERTSVC